MTTNETLIPCGEYPILIDYRTKGWREIGGESILVVKGHNDIRGRPAGRRGRDGYRFVVTVTSTPTDAVAVAVLSQQTGDRRVLTIYRYQVGDQPATYEFSNSKWQHTEQRPLVLYPDLQRALEYVFSLGHK